MNFKLLNILLASFIVLLSCKNKVQPFPEHFTTIEEIGEYYINQPGNVGLSIGIINDSIVQTFHFGKIAVYDSIAPTDSSFYEIGSITKTFTALAFAILNENEKFKQELNRDIVFEYTQNPNFKTTSLTQLMTHTSGLTKVPTNLLPANPLKLVKTSRNPYKDYSREDFFEYLKDCKLKNQGVFQYSNSGPTLLGIILSEVYGKGYMDMLRELFLHKIGMTNTAYPLDSNSQKLLVKAHTNRGAVTEHWEFDCMAPSGALRSNTTEMLNYLKFWIQENENPTLQRARNTALKLQHSDKEMSIAYGWIYEKLNSEQYFYWHNGATGGFRTFTGFVPSSKKGVVIMSNTGNQVDDAGRAILKIL